MKSFSVGFSGPFPKKIEPLVMRRETFTPDVEKKQSRKSIADYHNGNFSKRNHDSEPWLNGYYQEVAYCERTCNPIVIEHKFNGCDPIKYENGQGQ